MRTANRAHVQWLVTGVENENLLHLAASVPSPSAVANRSTADPRRATLDASAFGGRGPNRRHLGSHCLAGRLARVHLACRAQQKIWRALAGLHPDGAAARALEQRGKVTGQLHGVDRSRDLRAAPQGIGLLDPGQDGDELVAPESGGQLSGKQRRGEHPRGLDDQAIAGGIPEHVVGGLEAVEVEQQQRQRRQAVYAVQLGFERAPVAQPGQGVGVRQAAQLGADVRAVQCERGQAGERFEGVDLVGGERRRAP